MQIPKEEVSPTLRALLDRADAAYDRWRAGNDGLQAANWLVVTALVREQVPDATGIRTTGEFNEGGLLRLSLVDILRDGTPLVIDMGLFSRLEDDLSEPLMTIAEVETNPELWLTETDHDLPELPAEPEPKPVPLAGSYPVEVLVWVSTGSSEAAMDAAEAMFPGHDGTGDTVVNGYRVDFVTVLGADLDLFVPKQ